MTSNWTIDAETLSGQTGSHYDLAELAESKGFEVVIDSDNNNRSIIVHPGMDDFCDREIGEIVGIPHGLGDDEAIIRM